MPTIVSVAVEGDTDEAVVQRLIRHIGAEPGPVYGRNGKPDLRARVEGYNHAARRGPWLILVDLGSPPTPRLPPISSPMQEPAQHEP